MATESVKILIEAEDQASAKIAAASKEVENRIKNIKDVGGKAKASTEFLGTLAGALGGSEIAGFASQLGGLTEKVSAFSEVQKAFENKTHHSKRRNNKNSTNDENTSLQKNESIN